MVRGTKAEESGYEETLAGIIFTCAVVHRHPCPGAEPNRHSVLPGSGKRVMEWVASPRFVLRRHHDRQSQQWGRHHLLPECRPGHSQYAKEGDLCGANFRFSCENS